jgi:hypothetical protein
MNMAVCLYEVPLKTPRKPTLLNATASRTSVAQRFRASGRECHRRKGWRHRVPASFSRVAARRHRHQDLTHHSRLPPASAEQSLPPEPPMIAPLVAVQDLPPRGPRGARLRPDGCIPGGRIRRAPSSLFPVFSVSGAWTLGGSTGSRLPADGLREADNKLLFLGYQWPNASSVTESRGGSASRATAAPGVTHRAIRW